MAAARTAAMSVYLYFSKDVAAKMLLPSGIWMKPFTFLLRATG